MFKIFEKLGGKEAALDVIERRLGFRPSINAVKNWNRDRKVSGRATLAFMLECQERGIPFEISDCARSDKPSRRVNEPRDGFAPRSAGSSQD